MKPIITLLLSIAASMSAHASQNTEQVRSIGVYVQPYYAASNSAGDAPMVNVHPKFDLLLQSSDPKALRLVEASIKQDPGFVSPMTMMALSIRMYDAGLRDDSVFWHYVAKDRMTTTRRIISSGIEGAVVAISAFVETAGPVINGYAFCDIDKQIATRERSLQWVKDNPYGAIFLGQFPSNHSDRGAALSGVLDAMSKRAAEEKGQLMNPETRAKIMKARVENGAVKRYCW